jgi:hypothetical protein
LGKRKVVEVAVNGSGILGMYDQYRTEDTVQKEQETLQANGPPGQQAAGAFGKNECRLRQLHFQFLNLL